MAELSGRPCSELWKGLAPWNVRFDVLARPDVAKELLSAALFGPVVNSVVRARAARSAHTPRRRASAHRCAKRARGARERCAGYARLRARHPPCLFSPSQATARCRDRAAAALPPQLNLILVPPLITPYLERPFSLASELGTHAAGSLALALGGGYSNYIAISNTAVHL
eukprot:7333367-Prymnesium_polylepis.1